MTPSVAADFPLAEFLGMVVEVSGDGQAVARLEVAAHHLNPNGVVHGAVLFALVDTAMGAAVLSALDGEHRCASVEVHLRFLRSVADGALEATAGVVHRGRRIVHLDGEVTDADGRAIATATGTFAALTRS